MKRRSFIWGLIMAFTFCMSVVVYADDDIKVMVNSKKVQSDVAPINVDGSVMLPFRAILNSIGVPDSEIEWNDKSKYIEIRHNNKYVFLAIGNRGAVVEQGMIMLDVAPFIQDGRVMVPVRFITETFGAEVKWDGDTRTVNIKIK